MWRRAVHYLGLGPDEDYDDYDLLGGADPEVDRRDPGQRDPAYREPRRPAKPPREATTPSTVRTLSSSARGGDGRAADGRAPSANDGPSRPTPSSNGHAQAPGERAARSPRSAVVRPLAVPPSAKPHVVSPAAFTDAQEVADHFRRNVPVIVNLQGVERDLMRRIIDFASGLCYGLSGQMERVANHVYLLTPSDVEVSPEERRRLRERGFEA
jgi:cell division inhibitor SepF